jgi:membrane-bound ClpP family serine protease
MTASFRQIVALVGMTIGLVALVIDSANKGWTVLGTVGVVAFAVAIAAELLTLQRARGHS